MTNCCANVGALSKLAIGLASDPEPTRIDFTMYQPTRIVKTLSDGSSQTIRGTLDPIDTNVAEGMLFTYFRTRMWMSAAKNDILLPCLGFEQSPTDTFTLVDSLPESTIIVGPAGSDEITWGGCVPTDVIWSGRKGTDPIMMDIGWVAKTRTANPAGTFFVDQDDPPMVEGYVYPYPDGTYSTTAYTYLGEARYFPMFRLALDYGTIVEYNQSVTPVATCPTKHDLTFGTSALYSTCDSTTDLLEDPMDGDTTGSPLIIDLQRVVQANTYRTIFTVANAKMIAQDPAITKPDWIRLPINLRGYATGSTPLLTIVNDAT